jgi:hypothetical protein
MTILSKTYPCLKEVSAKILYSSLHMIFGLEYVAFDSPPPFKCFVNLFLFHNLFLKCLQLLSQLSNVHLLSVQYGQVPNSGSPYMLN